MPAAIISTNKVILGKDLGLSLWLPATFAILLVFSLLNNSARSMWYSLIIDSVLLISIIISLRLLLKYEKFRGRVIVQILIVFSTLTILADVLMMSAETYPILCLISCWVRVFAWGIVISGVFVAMKMANQRGNSIEMSDSIPAQVVWAMGLFACMITVYFNQGSIDSMAQLIMLSNLAIAWFGGHLSIGLLHLYRNSKIQAHWAWFGIGVIGLGIATSFNSLAIIGGLDLLNKLGDMLMISAFSSYGYGVILMSRSVSNYVNNEFEVEAMLSANATKRGHHSAYSLLMLTSLLVLQEFIETYMQTQTTASGILVAVTIAVALGLIITTFRVAILDRREAINEHLEEVKIYIEALQAVNLDGKVTPREKKVLSILRNGLNISMSEHKKMIDHPELFCELKERPAIVDVEIEVVLK